MNFWNMLDGGDLSRYQYDTPADGILATTARWAQSFHLKVGEYVADEHGEIGWACLCNSAPFAFCCAACLREWYRKRHTMRMSWSVSDKIFEDDAKRLAASGKFVPRVLRAIKVNGRPDWINLTPVQYLPTIRASCNRWHEEMCRRNRKENATIQN